MPPARAATRRIVNDENDENATARVTRAKAAALGVTDTAVAAKKPLAAKKTVVNVKTANDTLQPRKRAALGDVTNAGKGGETTGKVADAKKPFASKPAQTTATKLARQDSVRNVTKAKPSVQTSTSKDLKRPASNADVAPAPAPKRRASGSRSFRESSPADDENTEPETQEGAQEEAKVITETFETTKYRDGSEKVKVTKREETKSISAEEEQRQRDIALMIDRMDEEDAGDPLMVSEYAYEIFDYMKDIQANTQPNPNYMDGQDELEWKMRGVLVDWLLEVHTRFHLLPETLYLTINIIDRFLSMKKVQLERLQLVGVTAMFIASKYEEVLSPHIGNFVHVADDGFTEAEILSAERYILSTLNFDLSYPNPMHFVRRISKADNYDIATRTLAKYLLEISIMDHRFLEHQSSTNAAASMYLSRLILKKGPWDEILCHYSGYTEEEIMPCADLMIHYLKSPIVHTAFYKKYAGKRFMKASLVARQWAKSVAAHDGGAAARREECS